MRLPFLLAAALALTLAAILLVSPDKPSRPPTPLLEAAGDAPTALPTALAPQTQKAAPTASTVIDDQPAIDDQADERPSLTKVRVRGRILHSSGTSLEGERFRILAPLYQKQFHETWATLDSAGRFDVTIDVTPPGTWPEKHNDFVCAQAESADLSDAQCWDALVQNPWGLSPGNAESYQDDYCALTSPFKAEPALAGGGIDLGVITVTTGLLEITPEGILARGSIRYRIFDGTCNVSGSRECKSRPIHWFLPEGRYFYELTPDLEDATDDEAMASEYADYTLAGHCDLLSGQCTRLEFRLPLLEYVTIHAVSEAGPIQDASFFPQWDELGDLYHGMRIAFAGDEFKNNRILKTGRPNLSVRVYAEGYTSRSIPVPADARELTVMLQKAEASTPVASWQQGVNVSIDLPETLTDAYDVYLFGPAGQAERVGRVSAANPTITGYCDPGHWRVGVFNGGLMGYAGGMISGLLEVDVSADRFTELHMLAPLPPPHSRAARMKLDFTCADTELSLNAPMRMPDGSVMLQGNPRDDAPLPVALVGDGRDIPLSFEETDDGLRLGAALPARVRVTLSGDVANAYVYLTRENGVSAYAEFDNNVACLWLPPGSAELEVCSASSTLSRQTIDVPAGGALEISVDNRFGVVRLLTPPKGPEWQLYRRLGDRWEYCRDNWRTGDFTLPAGDYRAVVNEQCLQGKHDFTVNAGQHIDLAVEVKRSFEAADVFLPLPTEFADVAVEGKISVVSAELAQCMNGNITYRSCWNELSWRYAPGGILLLDFPVGAEVCLSGRVGRGDHWYQLIPDVVVASTEARRIASACWKTERSLSAGLGRDVRYTQWRAAGTYPRVEGSDLPVGNLTVYFGYGDHEEAFTLTIPPGEGDYPLPKAVQDRLRELGWLDDG